MPSFASNAVKRVEEYLKNYDSDNPAEILADVVHYCRENEIDFVVQLELAHGYVESEEELDGDQKEVTDE